MNTRLDSFTLTLDEALKLLAPISVTLAMERLALLQEGSAGRSEWPAWDSVLLLLQMEERSARKPPPRRDDFWTMPRQPWLRR